MKNCSLDQRAKAIVGGLAALLDGECVKREIDVPVDRVLESFALDPDVAPTQALFHDTIGRFMHEIHLRGLRLKRNLNQSQSLAEAIDILRDYPGQGTAGYQVAIYDALHHEDRCGIRRVVEWIAEAVKRAEKRKYMEWVLAASWEFFSWTTKCQVTAFLVETLAPFLPKSFLSAPVAQLTDNWRDMLFLYLDADRILGHLAEGKVLFSDYWNAVRDTAA